MTRSNGKSYRYEHTVREKRSTESTSLAARRKAMLACENFDGLARVAQQENTPAGCSKRPDFSPAQPWRAETRLVPSKAAASEEARRTLRYVEPLSDARTTLADFFSILLVLALTDARPVPVSVEASARTQSTRCGTGLLWSLSSNSKCNTTGPDGLRCCHAKEILSTHEC